MTTRRHVIAVAGSLSALAAAALAGCASAPSAEPTFRLPMADGTALFVRRWASAAGTPKGVVQIVHGAAEHSGRYDRFAQALNQAGWIAYADDHRGHGNTRVRSGALGDAGPDAWNNFVRDEKALNDHIRAQHPGLPVFMVGHSMGSFIAQDYAERYGSTIAGLVLSGSNGVLVDADKTVAALDGLAKQAPMAPSPVLAQVFAQFNAPFANGKPGFEWLSRDPAEVAKYQADPMAGFAFNNELVRDMFVGMRDMWKPENEARIPMGLPVYVVSGDQDPVGGNTEGLKVLLANYKRQGLTDVSSKFYPGARHEILNETNRDEVTADILRWLDSKRR